jgi:putative transposase
MLPLNKHQNSFVSQKHVYGTGPTTEKSNIPKQKEVIEDTSLNQPIQTLPPNLMKDNRSRKSSIVEFRLENNPMISTDKKSSSSTNIQNTKSSKTSVQESTGKEEASKGFWKASSMEKSKKLWLPTETALQGSDTRCLNGFSKSMEQSSFVSMMDLHHPQIESYKKISCRSSQSLPPNTMEEESIQKDQSYCRKTRFYPSSELKTILDKCFGATRYLTNQALEKIKSGTLKPNTNPIIFRDALKYRDRELTDSNSWLKDIPYDTRDEAIRQLCSNIKTGFTQIKNKTIKSFEMRFKSKRNERQACFINKNALKNRILFKRRIKTEQVTRYKEDISQFSEHGTLTVTKMKGRYFIHFPLKRRCEPSNPKFSEVALDPGVRTFQTFYSPEGICGKLGNGTYNGLKRIFMKEDRIKSVIASEEIKRSTRRNLKNRCFKLRTKARNTVTELHRKACHYLTTNFKTVYLPEFKVKRMVEKKGRKIGPSTARGMLALSHFAFKERLLHMAERRCCSVVICTEEWTSKTCGVCGEINHDLGGAKTFTCNCCSVSLDRDYNGARNIHLKNSFEHRV